MPKLIVLCGLPAVGKTTLAKSLATQGTKVVSSDEYRRFITGSYGDSNHDAFIRRICLTVVKHFLEYGMDVVYDATNPTLESRAIWIELASELSIPVVCMWVEAEGEIAHHRNNNRENIVPDWVIDGLKQRFIPPSTAEGFSEVIRVSG